MCSPIIILLLPISGGMGLYIDDLLLVWEGSHNEAKAFVAYINDNTWQLKSTHTFDVKVTNFLDLTLRGDRNTGISVSPYRKPTLTNSTLMANSCHPSHVTKNVPGGELINLKRNCSDTSVYSKIEAEALARHKAHKYPKWALNRASRIVSRITREKLMSIIY